MAHPVTQDLPPAPDARARECKQKLDGSAQRFELEPWLVTPQCFVGRWTAGPDNPFGARAGITSWGVWWRTRPYGVYRIHDVDGALLLQIDDSDLSDELGVASRLQRAER